MTNDLFVEKHSQSLFKCLLVTTIINKNNYIIVLKVYVISMVMGIIPY